MSEPVQTLEATVEDYVDLEVDTLSRLESELATNRLNGASLPAGPTAGSDQEPMDEEQTPTDWLALLSARPGTTELLADELPPAQPRASGMAGHARPPRMAPTLGARIAAGLRRGAIVVLLAAMTGGAMFGAGYVVKSTPLLAALFATPSQAPAAPQGPAPGALESPRQGQAPGPQARERSESPPRAAEAAPVTGTAIELQQRGIAAYKAGDFDKAILYIEGSTSLDSDDAISYYQLGLAYMAAQGREHALEDAEMAFRTAVSLHPDWASAHHMLAESLLRRGFYKEAIPPALQATKLEPKLADAWMTLGRAYQGAGQVAEATRAFAEAARLAPPPPISP